MNELQAVKIGDIAKSEFGPTLAKFAGVGGELVFSVLPVKL